MSESKRYVARSKEIAARRLGGETMIMSGRDSTLYTLNEVATVIWCRQAPNPGEPHQRRAAARLGARWLELDTGHYPMLSMPDELTHMLTEAA